MSNIEWTEATWNPIVGCSVVSPGCTNCYAMTMAARLEAMATLPQYTGMTRRTKAGPVWTGKLSVAPEHVLLAPLRRRKPTTYFVNSMGDLFHEDVPDAWIDRVFAVMALSGHHTYQVLTKRSARMRSYISDVYTPERIWEVFRSLASQYPDQAADLPGYNHTYARAAQDNMDRVLFKGGEHRPILGRRALGWPLQNIWLGVSAEDERRADERIPDLLATPATVRFVSAEPLLGPIDFTRLHPDGIKFTLDALTGRGEHLLGFTGQTGKLDWIIVGGESGAGARHMEDAWAESIVQQCAASGTVVFVKQMGGPVKARMRPIPAHLMVRQFPGDALASRPVCEEVR